MMRIPCGMVIIALAVAAGYTAALPAPAEDRGEGPGIPAQAAESTNSIHTENEIDTNEQSPGLKKIVLSADADKTSSSGTDKEYAEEEPDHSASVPSWKEGDLFRSISPEVNEVADSGRGKEMEPRQMAGRLEPLYQSISRLKSVLGKIRDVQQNEEWDFDEEEYISYLSAGESYGSSASEELTHSYTEIKDDKDNTLANFNEIIHTPKNVNLSTIETPKTNVASDTVEPALRFKRDLDWILNRGVERMNGKHTKGNGDASSSPGTEGNAPRHSGWEVFASGNDVPFDQRLLEIGIRREPKYKRDGTHAFDLDAILNAYLNKLKRRRRNKEDLHTFLQNMPTLEGLRKRSSFDIEPEVEDVIPDPGPFFPDPPNLPPPDNIIHPVLSPDETLVWQPVPDFEEDNALREEQTNGVEMMQPRFNDRLQYLKNVERSIMMQPLEDLAIQLAGGAPLLPDEAQRVRRVMQIPPPPPYGRKVVKSLYRKKAFGFPFVESSYDELSDVDAVDEREEAWEDRLPFGRTQGSEGLSDSESDLIARLLSDIVEKKTKDRLLSELLYLRDVAPKLRNEIILEALVEEANEGAAHGYPEGKAVAFYAEGSEPDGNLQWVSSVSGGENDDGEETKDISDTAAQEDSGRENGVAEGGDGGDSPAEGARWEASVPAWGTAADEKFHSNISPGIGEMKTRVLFNTLIASLKREGTKGHS